MPQIDEISLVVGAKTIKYVPVGTQRGKDEKSRWTTSGPTLSLDEQDQLTHVVTQGSANRHVKLDAVTKYMRPAPGTVPEIQVVSGVGSGNIAFTFPKTSTVAERTYTVDAMIAYLTKVKTIIVSTEMYY